MLLRCCLFLLSFWLVLVPQAFGDIEAVHIAGAGDPTRIIISADRPLSHQVFLQNTPSDGQVTPGLLIDFDAADWRLADRENPGRAGIVSYAWKDGRLRFQFDRPFMISQLLDLPPTGEAVSYRLVIDLVAVSDARFQRAVRQDDRRLAALEARPVPVRTLARPPTPLPKASSEKKRRVIVIDPGHGGKDPGTTVSTRGLEKDIVLLAALELRRQLAGNPAYDVRLTRSDDSFLELDERVTLARSLDADLFISIHADSVSKPEIEGAAVYTLSAKGQKRVDDTAKDNNWSVPLETGDAPEEVTQILETLVKRETLSNSAMFANYLIPELAKAGPILRRSHRQGNLFVLLAPDVPAVLVELGFLSNRRDARRLASRSGRTKAASAMRRAIDHYFAEQDLLLVQN